MDGCGAMHRGLRLSHRTSACVGLCGVSRKGEPSSAFEQIGGLCKLVRPTADGSVDEMTLNVEYNQLDSVRPARQPVPARMCGRPAGYTHVVCGVERMAHDVRPAMRAAPQACMRRTNVQLLQGIACMRRRRNRSTHACMHACGTGRAPLMPGLRVRALRALGCALLRF